MTLVSRFFQRFKHTFESVRAVTEFILTLDYYFRHVRLGMNQAVMC